MEKNKNTEKYMHHLLENDSIVFESLIYVIKILNGIKNNNIDDKLIYLKDELRLHKKEELINIVEQYFPSAQQTSEHGERLVSCQPGKDPLTPDVRLMKFLYSFLPSRVAVDIGANVGDVSMHLMKTGYRVYAFEPYGPVYEKLIERLGAKPHFTGLKYAIGSEDGYMDLLIAKDESGYGVFKDTSLYSTLKEHSVPGGLKFAEKSAVVVRSISSLQKSRELPEQLGLLKIDAEGYNSEIISGIESDTTPVVTTEFWSEDHCFAHFDTFVPLAELVELMRNRKYYWYIVFSYTKQEEEGYEPIYYVSFYCNHDDADNNTWGNVFFFNCYEIFSKALEWCSAMLPKKKYF